MVTEQDIKDIFIDLFDHMIDWKEPDLPYPRDYIVDAFSKCNPNDLSLDKEYDTRNYLITFIHSLKTKPLLKDSSYKLIKNISEECQKKLTEKKKKASFLPGSPPYYNPNNIDPYYINEVIAVTLFEALKDHTIMKETRLETPNKPTP